jgi:hypothetical protein
MIQYQGVSAWTPVSACSFKSHSRRHVQAASSANTKPGTEAQEDEVDDGLHEDNRIPVLVSQCFGA